MMAGETAMQAETALLPEIDFATEELPQLHAILAQLRSTHRVAPVRYHKVGIWSALSRDPIRSW